MRPGLAMAVDSGHDAIVVHSAGGRQRGYTLIEVLVAFAVLALALTLLLGTLSGATRQVRWAADAGRAALHAQSLLAQTGVGEVLQPGRSDGVFEAGRYRWMLEVAPYDDPLRPSFGITDPFSPGLLQLRLAVEWGEGSETERIALDSLRLVLPDPTQGALP
ncbi:prepilin-type N-terminal cleavage/methylation domain-containing protein [soil metagenome]